MLSGNLAADIYSKAYALHNLHISKALVWCGAYVVGRSHIVLRGPGETVFFTINKTGAFYVQNKEREHI